MNKDRHIISELNSFFAESNNTKAIQGIMNVMSHITLNQRQMDFAKAANCKFTADQVLELMVLFPLFAIKNSFNFAGSVLGQMFACKKDMFYRFLSNEDINWRQIVYSVNRRLLSRIAMRSDSVKSTEPRCLIADDTDFPKTGRKGELLGRVFSHIKHTSILGYKGLFLLFTDGKTQTFVDFTLQGEMGKKTAKPQGLSQKQLDARYSKERDADSRTPSVAIFDDRVEFMNPGSFPAGTTPEDFIKRPHSAPINPTIAEVFFKSGVMEGWGRGLLNIVNECKAAGLPAPEFEIIPDFVCLTIRFKEPLKPYLSGEAGGQDDPINGPIKGLALEIYRIIKANSGIKKAAIAQKVNRSEATVKRYAKQLSEAKLIEYKDSNKTGGYFVK